MFEQTSLPQIVHPGSLVPPQIDYRTMGITLPELISRDTLESLHARLVETMLRAQQARTVEMTFFVEPDTQIQPPLDRFDPAILEEFTPPRIVDIWGDNQAGVPRTGFINQNLITSQGGILCSMDTGFVQQNAQYRQILNMLLVFGFRIMENDKRLRSLVIQWMLVNHRSPAEAGGIQIPQNLNW